MGRGLGGGGILSNVPKYSKCIGDNASLRKPPPLPLSLCTLYRNTSKDFQMLGCCTLKKSREELQKTTKAPILHVISNRLTHPVSCLFYYQVKDVCGGGSDLLWSKRYARAKCFVGTYVYI